MDDNSTIQVLQDVLGRLQASDADDKETIAAAGGMLEQLAERAPEGSPVASAVESCLGELQALYEATAQDPPRRVSAGDPDAGTGRRL